jgi:hypothetical protein
MLSVAVVQALCRAVDKEQTDAVKFPISASDWLEAMQNDRDAGTAFIVQQLGTRPFSPVDIPTEFATVMKERGFVCLFLEGFWQAIFHALQAKIAYDRGEPGAICPDPGADGQTRWIQWEVSAAQNRFTIRNFSYKSKSDAIPKDHDTLATLARRYLRTYVPLQADAGSSWWSVGFAIARDLHATK